MIRRKLRNRKVGIMIRTRHLPGLTILMIALIALTPLALASTTESWTDGIYDAETADVVDGARFIEDVVDWAPMPTVSRALTVVALLTPTDDTPTSKVALPAFRTRGPPAP